jgi:hypothetical protein
MFQAGWFGSRGAVDILAAAGAAINAPVVRCPRSKPSPPPAPAPPFPPRVLPFRLHCRIVMEASVAQRPPLVALLQPCGAVVQRDGLTPLHAAASEGHGTVVSALIDLGAHVDARDVSGMCLL